MGKGVLMMLMGEGRQLAVGTVTAVVVMTKGRMGRVTTMRREAGKVRGEITWARYCRL